jgi:ferrochelatase
MSQVRRGDPYPEQCRATAEGLAARLRLAPDAWKLVYQSRFGPAPWLQPYADATVRSLARSHPRLLVACPGFTADCLETLDEIGEVLAADFRAAGGERLDLVPCLNDHPAWIAALAGLVERTAATLDA